MRKKVVLALLLSLSVIFVSACGNVGVEENTDSTEKQTQESEAGEEKVTLRYAYWGSTFENEQMQGIAAKYEELHPDVDIECIYIPNADYTTKLTAMIASEDEPDIAHLFISDYGTWGEQGRFANVGELLDKDERYSVEDFIPNTFLELSDGTIAARTISNELIQLYYNVDLFEELGVEPLPTSPEEALTWDEFVETCQKLTVDVNGNNALSPDFDPDKIVTYGIDFQKTSTVWSAFVYQNGGTILSEDGSEYNLDDPASIDAIQKLSDLINVYHVAPDPLTSANANMSTTSALQTGQVAIICDGTWSNLDLSSIDINYDVACLPKMEGEQSFVTATSACAIFDTCENIDVAWDFYMFLVDPENAIDLYSSGLWMPLMMKYYEDEEMIAKWAAPGTTNHTEGFRGSAVEYTNYNNYLVPEMSVKGWTKIEAAIASSLDSVWLGEQSAEEVLTGIKSTVDPMVQGYFTFR